MKTAEIAKLLAGCAEAVCKKLLPNGQMIENDWCVGSISGAAGKSLHVTLTGKSAGAWIDFSDSSQSGNLIDLWERVNKIDTDAACREAEEWLELPETERRTASHWVKVQKTMRPGTMAQIQALAAMRKIPATAGLELATKAGQLFFGPVYDLDRDYDAWILTDSARINGQARRMDGKPWLKIGSKVKTIQGCKAAWPVGIAGVNGHDIALVEGGPDLLAAWHCLWLKGMADEISPVAMFGASNYIPKGALPEFSGKRVFIIPHTDDNQAGQMASDKWKAQLTQSIVQVENLGGIKDLNDLISVNGMPDDFGSLPDIINRLLVKDEALVMPEPKDDVEAKIDEAVLEVKKPETPKPTVRPITSYAYPSEDDPNTLLGNDDYLGRGGGLLFVSHAGAGKSSWIMDACMMWAIGQAWMGIKCNGALKSLIIQAEDSDRYIGKIFASFAYVNKLTPEQLELLTQNCIIVRLKGVSGLLFMAELERLTAEHKPDLVIINPVYLYADGDIGRSEYAQPFLLGLDKVNKAEKFAYILIHHTGKPAKQTNGKRVDLDDWESAYMGFGSSYFANWPRCTALLEPVPSNPGHYLIKLGKGGFNAGITKHVPQGAGFRDEPATRIAIKHSTDRMLVNGKDKPVYYWELDDYIQSEQITPKGGRPKQFVFSKFQSIFPSTKDKAMTRQTLFRYAIEIEPIKDTAFRAVLSEGVEKWGLIRIQTSTSMLYYLPVP